jgi:hypothetical protein
MQRDDDDEEQELFFSQQTISSLQDPTLWIKICPFLSIVSSLESLDVDILEETIKRNKFLHELSNSLSRKIDIDKLENELCGRGFFRLLPEQMFLPVELTENLALGVTRLSNLGYPPTFLLMFDETWIYGDLIRSILSPISGNDSIGDWFIFLVDPLVKNSYAPGPPHRDRPLADLSSFRTHSTAPAPKYCSVWLALTPATPENSCLYLVPRSDDLGYHGVGDAVSPTPIPWQCIVAQPLPAGGLLAFSHRLLHWGSTPQPPSLQDSLSARVPRIALSMAFADPSFEEPYFDSDLYLPFPPVGLRLGLVAGQLIQYEHLAPLDKHGIALLRRIFHSQKRFFNDTYFQKISSAIQFLEFVRKQQRNVK